MHVAVGLASAFLVGLTLGLIGGGGSILTVPILVYSFGIPPGQATGYSLFVVGATSLAGAFVYWNRRQVAVRAALWFAVPSLLTVYSVRRYFLPALPGTIHLTSLIAIKVDRLLMVSFAMVMVFAAVAMIRSRHGSGPEEKTRCGPLPKLLVSQGLLIGLLSGLFGAGGGFLIVPALVLFAGLAMPIAIGTSLVIIAAQSLLGFVGVLQVQSSINWSLLEQISALAVVGMMTGAWASRKVNAAYLKVAFGWFVLSFGIGIFVKELIH